MKPETRPAARSSAHRIVSVSPGTLAKYAPRKDRAAIYRAAQRMCVLQQNWQWACNYRERVKRYDRAR